MQVATRPTRGGSNLDDDDVAFHHCAFTTVVSNRHMPDGALIAPYDDKDVSIDGGEACARYGVWFFCSSCVF
jgi:hypothetical protein